MADRRGTTESLAEFIVDVQLALTDRRGVDLTETARMVREHSKEIEDAFEKGFTALNTADHLISVDKGVAK